MRFPVRPMPPMETDGVPRSAAPASRGWLAGRGEAAEARVEDYAQAACRLCQTPPGLATTAA
eukprot:3131566-Pyramimonas_sp.AAC.1